MSLKERTYSVLLISSSDAFNEKASGFLSASRYLPVSVARSIAAGERMLAERSYDFVIVNAPISGSDGARLAIDAVANRDTVVLLLVRSEVYPAMFDRSAEHGVFLLAKPLSRAAFTTALRWMESARERLRSTEKKMLSFEEKMEEIRLVNRAKWLLIRELKMTEPDAHRYIEKQAMDRCVARRLVAEEIVKTYA